MANAIWRTRIRFMFIFKCVFLAYSDAFISICRFRVDEFEFVWIFAANDRMCRHQRPKPLKQTTQRPMKSFSSVCCVIDGQECAVRHSERRRAEECQKLSLLFRAQNKLFPRMLTNLSSIRMFLVVSRFFAHFLIRTDDSKIVINEVNNNSRNKISHEIQNLINCSRVFRACQRCRNSVSLDFWLVGAVMLFSSMCGRSRYPSHRCICWKGYPCDNFFFLPIFTNTIFDWVVEVLEDGHWHSTHSISSKQIHRIFILITKRAFDVCVNSRIQRKSTFQSVRTAFFSPILQIVSVKCLSFTSLFAKWLLTLGSSHYSFVFFSFLKVIHSAVAE